MELLNRKRLSENKTCMPIFFFFTLFFFCSICALFSNSGTTSTAGPGTRRCLSAKAGHTNLQLDMEKLAADGRRATPSDAVALGDEEWRLARRGLGGLGSSPPRCTTKCGKCTPCRPVHVPVPPGTPVTAEYYPEAWRCKCGNKLYMP